MDPRFEARRQEMLDSAVCSPDLAAEVLPQLDEFLQPIARPRPVLAEMQVTGDRLLRADAIREAYKARFNQESVLRTDSSMALSF